MVMIQNRGEVATKLGFGLGVLDAAKVDDRVVGIGADITTSVSMNLFTEEYPERFFSMGIAEQNCVGVSVGMALSGLIPIFSTYGVFASMRAADQIRVSLCYNDVKVIIGGAHAGISVGPDGATHQALEDLAVMRTLPNMSVYSPCDATQARLITRKVILEGDGPAYIRFGREPVPDFTDPNAEPVLGKGDILLEGADIALFATGHMVWETLKAAMLLRVEGIYATVINIHTLKPLDVNLIAKAAEVTGKVMTVEEHQVVGGLGSAVCEVLAEYYPTKVVRVGMQDRFGESGKPDELMSRYGLNAEAIYQKALISFFK